VVISQKKLIAVIVFYVKSNFRTCLVGILQSAQTRPGGRQTEEQIFWVPTKLVSQLHVRQLGLFKTEKLLGITRIQEVWGAFVPEAELRESLETSWSSRRISVLDVST